MPQGMSLSSEELTWLQANALIDPPIEGDDNPFLNNACDSASSTSSISFDPNSLYLQTLPTASPMLPRLGHSNSQHTKPLKPPRPEWIYRRPKSPVHARGHCKGHSMTRSVSFGRSPADPFTSHTRSHSDQSPIKSQSETALKHTPSSISHSKISSPKLMSVRPPSISSSSSVSTSTSRSSSPRTPASSPYTKTRRLSCRLHPENDSTLSPLFSSCLPSKSILTRTSSISTKESSLTGHKSVKFAAAPVVHYATASYWDLENFDIEETSMGINIDAMDVDDAYPGYQSRIAKNSSGMLDIVNLRESQCATPTPEREKAKTKGLKRFMSLTRKPLATTTTSTSVATVYRSQLSPRPVISMPYQLGTHPTSSPYSTAAAAAGSAPDLVGDVLPLRSAPSLESFRSSKSSGKGSVKSTLSTRGLRTWLSRTTGWNWVGQSPEFQKTTPHRY